MEPDLLVIGGGAAGMAAARAARHLGKHVVLVQDGEIGGDCTFTGCVPSKTLLEASERGRAFDEAMKVVRETVAQIAATESADVLRGEGIDVLEGRARLTGRGTAVVDGQRVQARRLIVATGAAPAVPPIPGLADVPYLTSDTAWDLTEAPASLIVLGGGAIGCELAYAFAGFGVRVTVLEGLDRLLAREEPDASDVITGALRNKGIEVRTGVQVQQIEQPTAGTVRVRLSDGTTADAEQLLVTTGRKPTSDDLDLPAAGVQTDDRGFIRVNSRLETSARGVYAVGDVTGMLQFTHAADEMGRTAAINALRWPLRLRFRTDAIPWVTFTQPEVARIGMTEAQAAAHGGRVAYLPMADVDRAITAGRTDGFIKLIAGPKAVTRNVAGGRLLGATIVADRAGEMIHEIALAMRTGMFTGRLAQTVHAYPTWSTGVRSTAAQFFVEQNGRRARPAQSS